MVFSNESALRIRWPKYWSFSFNISPSNEHPGLISRMDWLDLLAVQGTLKSLLQHHSSKAAIRFRYTAKWFSYPCTCILSSLNSFPIQILTESPAEFPVLYSRSMILYRFLLPGNKGRGHMRRGAHIEIGKFSPDPDVCWGVRVQGCQRGTPVD